MNKPVILAAGTSQMLPPYDNANQFVRAVPITADRFARWTAWSRQDAKPSRAARPGGHVEDDLREVNHIPPRMLVRPAPRCWCRAARSAGRCAEHLAGERHHGAGAGRPLAAPRLAQGRQARQRGQRRQSAIASAPQVAQWNGVSAGSSFRPGQAIVVMWHRPAKAASPPKSQRRPGQQGHARQNGATKKAMAAPKRARK